MEIHMTEIRIELSRTKTDAAAIAKVLITEGYEVVAPESYENILVSDASKPEDVPLVDYATTGKKVWLVVGRR